MLTFEELVCIDEAILEFIEEVEEAGELDSFYEWIETDDLGLDEDCTSLQEKESMAAYGQRMRKQGRRMKRMSKRATFQRQKKRSQLKRKTKAKVQTSSRQRTHRQVIPGAIMKLKGTVGAMKKKMWKAMKASVINRKMKPMSRQIIRDEPKRQRRARKNMASHRGVHASTGSRG